MEGPSSSGTVARESTTSEYASLIKREKDLEQEISKLKTEEREFRTTKETMDLLHRYNDVKDAAHSVMGVLAARKGIPVTALYQLYNLPLREELEKPPTDVTRGLEWYNVSEGLSTKRHLSGKLVILDFFTYCCINCMHILPDLSELERKFSIEDGLVVIGVHSAKFSNERDAKRLLSAVQRYGIAHPVVNDNTLSVWRNLGITCWPTLLMIGPEAQPLAVFVGEGHKQELFLYVEAALVYFKSLNRISSHTLPLEPARHLLPRGNTTLLFPGKVAAFLDEQSERLVISDSGNNRVIITDTAGKAQCVIGGCESGFRDGNFVEARFNAPQGVCAVGSTVYVADNENHAIRMIDLAKQTVVTVAGTGVQGHDYVGGKIGREQPLSSPWDVAIYEHDSDGISVPVLLIALAGTHQIWSLFLQDTVWWKNRKHQAGSCAAIVGSGREENRNNAYPHAAGLAQPSGLTVDQENKVAFFADSESSAIRRVDLRNGRTSTVCGANRDPTDLHDYGDADGNGYMAKLQHPLAVSWHPRERVLYVADTYNHKIKRVDPAGNCKTVYGHGKPVNAFWFDEPSGLAVSPKGNILYVADTNGHAVKMIDLTNESILTLPIVLHSKKHVRPENAHEFATTLDANGGELIITLSITFEGDLKLNTGAPQKWTILELPVGAWSTKAMTGDLSTPISIGISKGNGTSEVYVTLDLVACRSNECIMRELYLVYKVLQKSGAPSIVTEHTHLAIK